MRLRFALLLVACGGRTDLGGFVLPDQTIVPGSFSHVPLCNNSIMCG